MKIDTSRILPEGLCLEEEVDPSSLDLETEMVKLRRPIKIKASITRITNAVNVEMFLKYSIYMTCGRCLNEFELDLNKGFILNYIADKTKPLIDLDPDIIEEIILDYPFKPLCNPECKGLCPKCGNNVNEGKCSCK